jgi:hypothetical protein
MNRLGSREKGKGTREKMPRKSASFSLSLLAFPFSLVPFPLAALWIALWQPPSQPPPPPEEFGRRVRTALQLDYQVQKEFTYLERRRDVRISRLGKVTIGPLRTFEVFPSDRPGGTYKRLIEVDGKPVPPDELARRDAEHARDLRERDLRVRSDGTRQPAARSSQADEEQRDREAILADAIAVFQPAYVGRESVDGEPVLVADLKPRADARVTTREGRWMKRFAGRMWVAADDYQLVKIDMRAFDDITIGWGVVGRINTGSRVLYSRRRFEHAWLPAEVTYEASGRTLLFRPFQFTATTTFSGYKRR